MLATDELGETFGAKETRERDLVRGPSAGRMLDDLAEGRFCAGARSEVRDREAERARRPGVGSRLGVGRDEGRGFTEPWRCDLSSTHSGQRRWKGRLGEKGFVQKLHGGYSGTGERVAP